MTPLDAVVITLSLMSFTYITLEFITLFRQV